MLDEAVSAAVVLAETGRHAPLSGCVAAVASAASRAAAVNLYGKGS